MNPKLNRLRALRKERGLTTSSMANILEMSQSMYSYIEIGKKRLSYEVAIRIADFFNTTPDNIFYDDFKQFFTSHNI